MSQFDKPKAPDQVGLQPNVKPENIRLEGFDSVSRIIAKSGNVALGTNEGLREKNEDMIVFDPERDAFAVIDGMGGYAGGAEAARAVAEALTIDFQKPIADPRELQTNAFRRIKEQAGLYEAGAVYIAGRIEKNGKELSIYQAGDCELIVLDQYGKIKFASERTSLHDAPSGRSPGRAETQEGVNLMNYDYIVAATDGLWDNATKEDVIEIILRERKVEKILPKLEELAKRGMTEGLSNGNFGNRDNITVFLYQIIPVPLRGK